MEIKVGIQHIAREITVESDLTTAQVEEALTEAMTADDGILSLADQRGRTVLIPVKRIAYLDLGQEHVRPVGFGAV